MSKLRGQGRQWQQLTQVGTYTTSNGGDTVELRDQNGEFNGSWTWSSTDSEYKLTEYPATFNPDDTIVMTTHCFMQDTHGCVRWLYQIYKVPDAVLMEVPQLLESGWFQYNG